MIENINNCLALLSALGVSVDGLVAKDVRDGNLKAILNLFFSLSRHKQQQKQATVATAPPNGPVEMLSKLPSPFRQQQQVNSGSKLSGSVGGPSPGVGAGSGGGGGSSIPTPSTVVSRKQTSERSRGIPPTSTGPVAPLPTKVSSAASSRSASPGASPALSFIPQPTLTKSSSVRNPPTDKHPLKTVPGGSASGKSGNVILRSNSHHHPNSTTKNNNPNNTNNHSKNSMLDKLKFFNTKEKNERTKAPGISKRTSSSSGFSSARSERSDSSNSLCSETKLNLNSTTSDTRESSPAASASTSGNSSPRLAVKAFARKTFGKSSTGSSGKEGKNVTPTSSPKDSRKSDAKPSKSKAGTSKITNNNNIIKTCAGDYSDTKHDGNTRRLSSTPETVTLNDARGTESSTVSESANSDRGDDAEAENNAKLYKVSLIPKGDKGGKTGVGKQQCSSKDSFVSDSISVKGSLAANTTMAGTNASQTTGVLSSLAGATSIPKPTAAVKGTSKAPKEDRRSVSGSSSNLNQNSAHPVASSINNSIKDMHTNSGPSNIKTSLSSKGIQRVAPAKSDASTLTDPPKSIVNLQSSGGMLMSSLPRNSKSDRSRPDGGPVGVSIAMVSPMQSQCKEVISSSDGFQEQASNGYTGNQISEQILSKNNCTKADILSQQRSSPKLSTSTYSKVETTFDSSDKVITRETTPGTPRETTFSEESEDIVVNIKPMQPIIRASPYSYMRNLGVYTTRSLAPSVHIGLPSGGAGAAGSVNRLNLGRHQALTTNSAGSDPLQLYAYTSQLKRPLVGGPGALEADYAATTDGFNFAAGYMSDGDTLRSDGRSDDIGSGYMSEGGASLYARRLTAKAREAPATIKECPHKAAAAFFSGDSFDDSSSVSSGISDTIAELSTDENLTGSSVSSDQTNPYASLKRSPKDVIIRAHGSSGPKKVTSADMHGRLANSGSSRASNVKKADCAQQTESSAFRQVSSSAWKKYLLDKELQGKSSDLTQRLPQDKADLLRRGKSDLDPSKTRDKRTTGGTTNSGIGILRKSTTASGAALHGGLEKQNPGGSPKSKRKGIAGSCSGTGGGSMRQRMSNENLLAGPNDKYSDDVNYVGASEYQGQCRGPQGIRGTQIGAGMRCYSAKRPTSTCSVSSNSSSKSAGSRVSNKRSSSEKLSEFDRTDTSSEAGFYGSESSRGLPNLSGIPRPGSAPIRSEHQYLQHHHMLPHQHQQILHSGVRGAVDKKTKVCASMQTGVNDLHNQDRQSCSNGFTNDQINGYSSISGYHHQKVQNATSSCLSPASGHKIYSNRGAMNSTGTSLEPSHVVQTSHGSCGISPRLSVHSTKPQELQLAASSPPSSSSLYGIVGLDHPAFSAGSGGTYPWLRHSPSAASALSRPGARSSSGWLTEAESMESLASSLASSVHAHLQHARASSLTHARLLLHQRETSASPVPRLSRSNSIRSTKSEKLYPSMLQRSDVEPFLNGSLCSSAHSPGQKEREQRQSQTLQLHHHSSQPASPTPGSQNTPGFLCPMNSGSVHSASSCSGNGILKSLPKDDMHGSALSLVSTNSSLYSSSEEKQAQEIRKLRHELNDAHERVQDLTSQLSTNKLRQAKAYGRKMDYSPSKSSCHYPAQQFQAHVVAAFEQSLSNMTNRLQTLTTTAERKDSELNELRSTIEALRQKSVEAGLTTGNYPSMHRSPNLVRRHTFNTSKDSALTALQEQHMSRQLSTDSVSSINSLSSACSVASQTSGASQKSNDPNAVLAKKKKKKGWLRSSFSKAFSRSKKNKNGSVSDVEDRHLQSDTSAPNSPLLCSPHAMCGQGMKISHSSNAIYDKDDTSPAPEMVQELKKQLREKDMVLTDIRLEALTSAHQLESLKETVTKMRSEMLNLKEDNKRLQRLVSTKSPTSSQSSLHSTQSVDKRSSNAEQNSPTAADTTSSESLFDGEGKRITIAVFLGCHGDYEKYLKPSEGQRTPEALIGSVTINSKTKWDVLDNSVRRTFKDYILRIDPVTNLGLNSDSIASYHIGEVMRGKDIELPELLPCGYVIGDILEIKVTLKGTKQNSVDALSFETLIPKSIVHRYISLLSEHRRIILCGPSGTGKTYLAHRLSEFLVLRSGKELLPGTIATFSVDHKSAKELRQYLSNVAEQCENSASDLPSVIILDNLHHVGSLGEVFNGFLNAKYQKCPFIIGTMNQTTCSTTNLQLHHNFRWVLCANHMEPVKGFLGRYLRRKLIEHETRACLQNNDLTKIIEWMSKTWLHLNKFLETHSSSDVTIGPRLFLSCPTDVSASQVWFTDLWNYSIVPYLLEAVREGLQLYGRRATWEDPTVWVMEMFPWPPVAQPSDWAPLLHLRPEDVGYDSSSSITIGSKGLQPVTHEMENDPLLNMLMRLQEAANYSSPHSNDSDTTSLDSHSSSLQTEEAVGGGGVESTI